ncbi:hypothetical protein AMECASPLE_008261, partial [Ameca splendens]
ALFKLRRHPDNSSAWFIRGRDTVHSPEEDNLTSPDVCDGHHGHLCCTGAVSVQQ